ncbi:MAG: tetratricopeptide repeat protein [Planctomycetota bacterium]|jgi:tetratricopeptide (TPR) repeat protein
MWRTAPSLTELLLPLLLVIGSGALVAQDPPATKPDGASQPGAQARMPVRVIAGRLVARCEVSTRFRRIPVNLFVDFDRGCGLELHNRAADGIKVDAGGGVPITIHLPGFNISVERREHGDEDFLNEFTKLYSKELGETACAGAIGSNILRNYHITFDLNAGFAFLENPREQTGKPPEEIEGTVTTSITLTNDQVWIPVRIADRRVLSMNLATSRYDTLVDEDLCEELERPAGDIGAVQLKTIDFGRYVACRPAEIVLVHADGVLGTIGLNVLEHFRVEVDRVNRYVRFRETKEARYPAEDLLFFQAMVNEDSDALESFLRKHPKTRLSREAAELLLTMLVDSGEPAAKLTSALDWMDKTRIEDLRSTEALSTMKMLLESQRPKVAILAGEIGVKSGRKDRYPESVHKLHAKLGELLLEQDEGTKAWEHLLSAAFGLPQDGMVNLHLGQFYEQQKRYKRAMSRFVQAVIQPESGALAIAGLERVQKAMGGEALSVDLVDKLIAGKVYNFGAATTFKPTKTQDTNRVVLVELFTNPHFGRRLQEGWRSFNVGGVMGQEGLLSHFPRQRVAVLTYHVDTPEPSALINPLSMHTADMYGHVVPTYTKINGTATGPGYGRWRDAEKIYNQNRALVLAALEAPSRYTITASASVEGNTVRGKVVAKGPKDPDLMLQAVLVERSVLYPGKGKVVVHRMVARAALTDSIEGLKFKPKDGAMTFEFKKSLADIRQANESYLGAYERNTNKSTTRLSTRIDPRQVSVVAFLRDTVNLEVLQAVHVDAKGKTPRKEGAR